ASFGASCLVLACYRRSPALRRFWLKPLDANSVRGRITMPGPRLVVTTTILATPHIISWGEVRMPRQVLQRQWPDFPRFYDANLGKGTMTKKFVTGTLHSITRPIETQPARHQVDP